MPERLGRRDGMWICVRRRPSDVSAEVEPRLNIRISTGIKIKDDKAGVKAAREARVIEIDHLIRGLLAGQSGAGSA